MVVVVLSAFLSPLYATVRFMAAAAGYTQLGLPHLCAAEHVSLQAKMEGPGLYVPMDRAVTMMLVTHRTLGKHNSCDKAANCR